ncbi:hypothetical protein B0H11DRAFT_2202001 [Mycena galericulata]|nr:hypothetical protein B0H11DRAFT_2202001 [Mycena galericulata]
MSPKLILPFRKASTKPGPMVAINGVPSSPSVNPLSVSQHISSQHGEDTASESEPEQNGLESAFRRFISTEVGAGLSSVVDNLLDDLSRASTPPANAGVVELAVQIDRLTAVESMIGTECVMEIRRMMESLIVEWDTAASLGKLDEFFDDTNNGASAVEKCSSTLCQILDAATFVGIDEVTETANRFKQLKIGHVEESNVSEYRDVTGQHGHNGRFGTEGGQGDGPHLDIKFGEHVKYRIISGGTGGNGGAGPYVGAKGGTGKGPVIRVSRGYPGGSSNKRL